MLRKSILFLMAVLAMAIPMTGCKSSDNEKSDKQPQLLVYCGITMVKPMRIIADTFEKEHQCQVILNQGGSEDLYQSLKLSRQGDLYLPGSQVYRENHLAEGLLGDFKYLGFNKASFLVQKGNPQNISTDLKCLLNKDLVVAIGNPESCSIGKQTKKILSNAGIYDQVTSNCFALSADSRILNNLLRETTLDLIINWRATAFFEINRNFIDVIDLDDSISLPKELLLNLLTFSKQPELARDFMDFAASVHGQAVFREFGFLDEMNPVDSPSGASTK